MNVAQNTNEGGLPASVHTEVVILGAMLLDPLAQNDAMAARLRAEDFLLDSHQRVYRVVTEMTAAGKKIDYTTVRAELERRKELEAIGGLAYLAYLTEGIPRNLNIESYIQIIKDKSMLRQVMALANIALTRAQDASEDALTVIGDLEAGLMQMTETATSSDLTSIPDLVHQAFTPIDVLYESGPEITGLETHYTEFDRMTAGLQDSDLIIIAARPSMGKTAWAINIAQNAAVEDGKIIAVFSLEMSKAQLFKRMLATQARVSARKMQSGFIGRDGREKVIRSLEQLMETNIFIDDTPGITLTQMRAKVRRLRQRMGGKLHGIVVDYLQLMSGGEGIRRGSNRTEEVSGISRGLKALAKEMRVPVIALSQLSRASETRGGDKRPQLSDLRESGSIEQDADVVAFIHRDEYYDKDNEDVKGKADIIIAKQRNGPTGEFELAWLEHMTRFENLSTVPY